MGRESFQRMCAREREKEREREREREVTRGVERRGANQVEDGIVEVGECGRVERSLGDRKGFHAVASVVAHANLIDTGFEYQNFDATRFTTQHCFYY